MNDKVFKIFTDFDGTVTTADVGEELFRKFGNEEKISPVINDLLTNRISAKESWMKLCESVGIIDEQKLNNFIDQFKVDESFIDFLEFCKTGNFELFILSDGFDYYINRILKNNGLENLKVYSNHLVINGGKLIPSFPYYDENCFSSANCKRNHIINHSSDTDFTVFIGDGHSDEETVEYCDFVFAKDGLLRYCEIRRITFFPFKNFYDVKNKLAGLNSKKRLKKRHRAQIKRKQAYTIE